MSKRGDWGVYTDVDGHEYAARVKGSRRGVLTLWLAYHEQDLSPLPTAEGEGASLIRGVRAGFRPTEAPHWVRP